MTDIALPGFPGEAVAAVNSRLDEAEALGGHVLLAVESGSRAWGFPSPDSDYDCRFLYARNSRDHLLLVQPRDVIEFPIVDEIDAGGWDLRKALMLALSNNVAVLEWATSPFIYRSTTGFRERLIDLLNQIVDPQRVARHYLGLARSQIEREIGASTEIRLKKLFYVIRPLVALDWMEARRFRSLPPMNLDACLAGIDLAPEVVEEIRRLIEQKKLQRELGVGSIPDILNRYISQRYDYHASRTYRAKKPVERDDRYLMAEDFYRREVERLS